MSEKLHNQLRLLETALSRLEKALARPVDEFVRDSAIQFYFAYLLGPLFEPASFYVGETSLTIPRLPLNIGGLTIAVPCRSSHRFPFNSLSKLPRLRM